MPDLSELCAGAVGEGRGSDEIEAYAESSRHVQVRVSHWPVLMGMCVWFAGRIISAMGVPVVDVVHVRMCMHEALVNMLVLVMFCQV